MNRRTRVWRRLHGTLAAAADRGPLNFPELLSPRVGARTVQGRERRWIQFQNPGDDHATVQAIRDVLDDWRDPGTPEEYTTLEGWITCACLLGVQRARRTAILNDQRIAGPPSDAVAHRLRWRVPSGGPPL